MPAARVFYLLALTTFLGMVGVIVQAAARWALVADAAIVAAFALDFFRTRRRPGRRRGQDQLHPAPGGQGELEAAVRRQGLALGPRTVAHGDDGAVEHAALGVHVGPGEPWTRSPARTAKQRFCGFSR